MTDTLGQQPLDCEGARAAIHRVLDGDPLEVGLAAGLDDHLRTCAACREVEGELRALQAELRSLPQAPLPAAALERVWERTVRRRFSAPPLRGGFFDWRFAAAAAVILMAAFLGIRTWQPSSPVAPPPTRAELARAAQEVRLVLSLTSRALRTSGTQAVRAVLADEVSPALQRVPVRWPAPDGRRRSES